MKWFSKKLLITIEKFQNVNHKMPNKGFQAHGERIYHWTFGLDRRLGKICNEKGLFLNKRIPFLKFNVFLKKVFNIQPFFLDFSAIFWYIEKEIVA